MAEVISQKTNHEPSRGLAIASLLCGVLSIPLSLVVIGGLFGLVGIVFGVTQLATARTGRILAWMGAAFSAIGGLLSIGMLLILLFAVRNGLSNINAMESFDGWVGSEAPDFIAQDTAGNYIQLAGLRGKCVLLDFRGAHCAACEKEEAYFAELRSRYSADELAIVGIGDPDVLKKSVEERRLSYPVVSARGLPRPYSDIAITPTAVFIDRSGRIQKILMGYSSLEELQANVEASKTSGVAPAQ